jgi:hypothetical protein
MSFLTVSNIVIYDNFNYKFKNTNLVMMNLLIIIIKEFHEDAAIDSFWSGFITRSKQHRVGVDAILY